MSEPDPGLIDDLRDLHKQATVERSHYYVGSVVQRSIAEIERLNDILNTPHLDHFAEAVVAEAKHQRFRWGDEDDAKKTAWEWFWCLGFLGGKAGHAALAGDWTKARHHTITAAAMLANWHRHISQQGVDGRVKPGHDRKAGTR